MKLLILTVVLGWSVSSLHGIHIGKNIISCACYLFKVPNKCKRISISFGKPWLEVLNLETMVVASIT